MEQNEYASCKYWIAKIRIAFIFREVNTVTSFRDVNEKRLFIGEPLNTLHFTPKPREEISRQQWVELHWSFSSWEIKSHSPWTVIKGPHFDCIFFIHLEDTKQFTTLQPKQNNLVGKKRQASLNNRVILALTKRFFEENFGFYCFMNQAWRFFQKYHKTGAFQAN